MRGVRKQFLILNGNVVLAFVKKRGGKFAECSAFEDITPDVKCKVRKLISKNFTKIKSITF